MSAQLHSSTKQRQIMMIGPKVDVIKTSIPHKCTRSSCGKIIPAGQPAGLLNMKVICPDHFCYYRNEARVFVIDHPSSVATHVRLMTGAWEVVR